MNLYLSRLCLNPYCAPALKLAADPYDLRLKLLPTLPCSDEPKPAIENQPRTVDLLFRVDATDSGPVVILQTSVEPGWHALELAPRALRCPPQTKLYDPTCVLGQCLAFRLLCQPAVRKSGQFGVKPNGKRDSGPRLACRTDAERLAWLRRKGASGGFAIETVGLAFLDWRNSKPLQKKGGNPTETPVEAKRRAYGPGEPQRLGAVRFDGILVVTASDTFRRTVATGVGPGKAFGFGLLSIAKAEP